MRAPAGFRGTFRSDDTARALYSEGAGPFRLIPAAVALPADVDDLGLLVAWATATATPLTPRGAGSGMPGGNLGSGVVVDMGAFDRPLRVTLARTATAGAAVTWQALHEAAAHFGFRLPPDPSSGGFCTLGGMVATNAAGARSLRYGSIRPWVRGLELLTTDGEAFWMHRAATPPAHPLPSRLLGARPRACERLDAAGIRPAGNGFPTTTKNSAGYALDAWAASGDAVDLLIGSEGTLAFITRVELTLGRIPDAAATVVLGLGTLDDLGEVVIRLLRLAPAAIELLDRSFLDMAETDLPLDGVAAILLVEFEGSAEAVEHASAAVLADVPAVLARRGLDAEARSRLWAIRHAASPALARLPDSQRSLQIIEDGCVPVARLADYVRGVHAAARAAAVPIVAFGHAGDGHLHVNALADLDRPDMADRLDRLRAEVTDLVIRLGGTPSGEHGDGRLRADALERLYDSGTVATFRRIKDAFDPAGILNPGVILPVGGRPGYKGGPTAPAIPAAVASALRARERDADWATRPFGLLEEAP